MNFSINDFKKYLNDISYGSLFYVYLKRTLLFVILPILIIYTIFFLIYTRSVENDTINMVNSNFLRACDTINNTIGKTYEYYSSLEKDEDVVDFLELTSEDIENGTPEKINTLVKARKNINRYKLSNDDYINNIYLYSFKSDFLTNQESRTVFVNQEDIPVWYYNIKQNNHNFMVADKVPNSKSLYVCLRIGTANNPEGLVIFDIRIESLLDVLKSTSGHTRAYNDGAVLFDTSKETTTEKLRYEIKPGSIPSQEVIHRTSKGYLYSYTTASNLVIEYQVPENALANRFSVVKMAILLLLVALILSFISSLYISAYFYNLICVIMNSIGPEELLYTPVGGKNELVVIKDTLLHLRQKNQMLSKELSNKITDFKKLQASSLQTQITPHFLFNTLNAVNIIVMNETKKVTAANKSILLLSDILAFALNTGETFVSIESEIENCKKYIQIEQLKGTNNFDVEWNIDESLMQHKTIKLLLQPIVENAISHGIKGSDLETNILRISAFTKGNCIAFEIANTGNIISKEKIKTLEKTFKTDIFPSNHIGMYNVQKRIKLMYGEEYGINITSDSNFTYVTLTIPFEKA